MSRLIEVQRVEDCRSPLAVRVGDVLLLRATGGRLLRGESSVEFWGPLLQALVAETGEIVSPMGPPNAVLVCARQPGSATVELFTGDPWHAPRSTSLEITVKS